MSFTPLTELVASWLRRPPAGWALLHRLAGAVLALDFSPVQTDPGFHSQTER
ncbi:MAG: hypothetical protein ACRD0K_24755 [Egibacteraceae bacterium]